jgi:glycosyltransferase involved in cell wall biosynthesis
MVSPYPPLRDGIAAYALQSVAALRREGHEVEVLSPGPSAAHHHLDLIAPRGGLALAKRVRDYDRVIVQFHPDVFFPHPASTKVRAARAAGLAAAFKLARRVEVLVHEVDYRWGRGRGPAALAVRRMWAQVDEVQVHTETEREQFATAFGVPRSRIKVTVHGESFQRLTRLDREAARRSLDLPADAVVYLAIGFIQPHKGFDRAIRAFAGLDPAQHRLAIVGSVRVEEPEYVAHLDELRALAGSTPGVDLRVGYVSDELFDRWVVASDVVVLPYRSIWSSSVMERAQLYDRPVIATAVGGLGDQAAGRPGVHMVEGDDGLAAAMWRMSRSNTAGPGDATRDELGWPASDRDGVMAEIRARAAHHRPVSSPAQPGTLRATGHLSAPLRNVQPLERPAPTSAARGASRAKRLVQRLTDWQIAPVIHHVNQLRQAAIDAIDRIETDKGDHS